MIAHTKQWRLLVACGLAFAFAAIDPAPAPGWTLVGWNDVGLHDMDPDYAVSALFPPGNVLQAQLLDANGALVRDATGITVTYEAIPDPNGSTNRTSQGKTNFWAHVRELFGVAPAVDVGLAGSAMPGMLDQPQPMHFDPAHQWFIADGIPLTPRDDAGHVNRYPLLRLTARNAQGAVLAATDIVLPVSDELNCKACHTSDGLATARPFDGWVHDADPEHDVRLNILRLHDDIENGTDAFVTAVASAGYDAAGLYATASAGTPILCARCHMSAALPGSGQAGVSPLTRAVHHRMAGVADPVTRLLLDAVENRDSCYRCHPGSANDFPRGVMGAAVAADGTPALHCQSCHGRMKDVAQPERSGWLDEPACQSCHTGTAITNNGQLRYTSVFEPDGSVRRAVDQTFATNPDTPAPGLSLYRFSSEHGGLQCEACHGPPHAEYPSAQPNDNLQSQHVQGHPGVLVECTACHASTPLTVDGGPHGLHPVGAVWVQRHPDVLQEGGTQACRACHGSDYRGTELSRVKGDRTFDTDFGRKHFWPGFQVGCYTCHLGPSNSDGNPNTAPVAADAVAQTTVGVAVDIALAASDADGDPLALRIVEQGAHGSVGLTGTTARYIPAAGFSGEDAFTFTASDGSTDGNLATVHIAVAAAPTPTPTTPPCVGDCSGDGHVAINELVRGVAIALSAVPVAECQAFDANGDGHVGIDELVRAVNAALSACPGA